MPIVTIGRVLGTKILIPTRVKIYLGVCPVCDRVKVILPKIEFVPAAAARPTKRELLAQLKSSTSFAVILVSAMRG